MDASLTRRATLGSTATLACAALAGVLSDPIRARAAAASLDTVSLTTPSGRKVNAALAKPAQAKAPAILVIHEFWGLNDQIKAYTKDLSDKGYLCLAADLMGVPPTSDPAEAQKMMAAVKPEEATETLKTWMTWLAQQPTYGGKIATLGFCFGGGWSLNAGLASPADATVMYYGRCDKTPDELKTLKGPVLGHFAKKDTFINEAMVSGFQRAMEDAGKTATVYWYDAEHGFANPTTARYDAQDAALAQSRTLAFLKSTIG
jgi:carboxymethylenebutenolidase